MKAFDASHQLKLSRPGSDQCLDERPPGSPMYATLNSTVEGRKEGRWARKAREINIDIVT